MRQKYVQVIRSNAPELSENHSKTLGVTLRDIRRITPCLSENYSGTSGVFLPNKNKFLGELTF